MNANRKAYRRYKYDILRQNRRDEGMEEKARLHKLYIPLEEVRREWLGQEEAGSGQGEVAWLKTKPQGIRQLQVLGHHSNIYQDVFGLDFHPLGFLDISYPSGQHVMWGEVIGAKHTISQPKVTLPDHLASGYATLTLTNPDGHLQDHTQELLHWMVANIPVSDGVGGDLSQGDTLMPYLPPVSPMGTGIHRFVFSLYTHPQPLPMGVAKPVGVAREDWLQHRLFSSSRFLATHPVKPYTFSFFQSQWDRSVRHAYQHILKYPEPIYGPERVLSPRRLRKVAVQEARQCRYTQL